MFNLGTIVTGNLRKIDTLLKVHFQISLENCCMMQSSNRPG